MNADARIAAVVPTYDERENVAALVDELLALPFPRLDVIVVDDRSPDGTADLVAELQASRPRLILLRREGPAGRGLAGRDGFLLALERGAEFVVEMDGDFSHRPQHVPELLRALDGADMAVGSRFVSGGSDWDRPLWRRGLTAAANLYARALLGLPIVDVNSGFRAYRREALERIDPRTLRSAGPSIVHEVLFRAARRGLRVEEVPIEFIDRRRGESKLTFLRLAAGYFWILRLALGGD
jgi:dolichol-phosphate mannosyltransferase